MNLIELNIWKLISWAVSVDFEQSAIYSSVVDKKWPLRLTLNSVNWYFNWYLDEFYGEPNNYIFFVI